MAPTDEIKSADVVAALARVAAPEAAAQVSATVAVGRSAAADRIAGIADRLRRGVLTSSAAVEELIEETVKGSLPGTPADSRLSQELRALLHSYVKDDPLLAAKISRLGVDS